MQEGDYYGLLVGWGLAGGDRPYVWLRFRITHDTQNGDWHQIQTTDPVEHDVFCSATDKAWEYTERKLAGLGFNGDFTDGVMDFGDGPKNDGVALTCELQQRDGKTREQWDLRDWGGQRPEPTNDLVRKLNAKYKKNRTADQTAVSIPPVSIPPVSTPPGPTDEDIRF